MHVIFCCLSMIDSQDETLAKTQPGMRVNAANNKGLSNFIILLSFEVLKELCKSLVFQALIMVQL